MERRRPELVTTTWWKEERGEQVFIDYNQKRPGPDDRLGLLGAGPARGHRVGAGDLGRAA